LTDNGFIDYIPANFFVFNQVIGNTSYIAVDELAYQAVAFKHRPQFDKLALFALLLSEVGTWKGASPEQQNPSEWARFFVIDVLSKYESWSPALYTADSIESFLQRTPKFEGNTRKLSTNLSFIFNKAKLNEFRSFDDNEFFANAIFLALDRYYLKEFPQPELSVGWAIETLRRYDLADLIGSETEFRVFAEKAVVRLFSAVRGPNRFEEKDSNSQSHLFAILSRDPAIIKRLPAICAEWLSSRLFVELALDEDELTGILGADYSRELNEGVARVHNSLPRPSLSGDEVIALFRGTDDDR
jgi:hypothetical protein